MAEEPTWSRYLKLAAMVAAYFAASVYFGIDNGLGPVAAVVSSLVGFLGGAAGLGLYAWGRRRGTLPLQVAGGLVGLGALGVAMAWPL